MKQESPPGSVYPDTLQILHLEDNLLDCALIERAIEDEGLECRFTRVASRRDFHESLEKNEYDLILCDFTVPGYGGAAALADARLLRPDTPFIFVSGTIGEEKAIEILKDGATDYVLKNRLARLGPSIRRALQESHERMRRTQAEEALLASTERLREMAENIQEVFWVRSTDGTMVHYVSPASEAIWGYAPQALYGNPARWLNSIVPGDRPRMRQALVLLGQGIPYTLEYRINRPDGAQRWIEERGSPVRNADGTIERVVAAASDISERKKLEEQLQQSQKVEAIGQLAGGIAHDFSNMLSVINGYSSLLLDKPSIPPEITEWLRQIYVAGGRAANLTRQLLIFSRKAQTHNQAVDLNEIVTELTGMLGRLIGEQITLQLDLAQHLPRTLADPGMMEQVLMNLVINARDAIKGTGAIVVSTGSGEVTEVDCLRSPDARPGPHVWLAVRDTGSGIPPEILPRIFEPFFTTKEAGRGTGLGLSTVTGIARQHGGWVEVESEVGTGTLFRMFLPLGAEETPAAPAPVLPGDVAGGRETVLLAEDEESVRRYALTVLEMYGYRVLQAASGREAIEVWKWHAPKITLLLTDLVMPDDISGLDLAERFQAERPDLKVIFSSGYNTDQASAMLATRKGVHFLQKPYQPKTLARLVREVIDGARASPSRAPFPGTAHARP
jgi:PAS domain S-box-containing protein